jgi:alpha-ketoglutarate-dependent taurine dioxygenase
VDAAQSVTPRSRRFIVDKRRPFVVLPPHADPAARDGDDGCDGGALTRMALAHQAWESTAFRPLSPALGVELLGIDDATLDSSALGARLERALLDHQVVLLCGLHLDPERFRRIARSLGPLRRVPKGMLAAPDQLDVQCLSNLDPDGVPTGCNPDPYALHWHTDGSATRIPSRYTVFYALRIPDHGAETSFVNTYAACSALSAERRRALVGRRAIHDPDVARWLRHGGAIAPAGTRAARRVWMRMRFIGRLLSPATTRHPVLRVHEQTGRPCLFLGDHAWRVTGGWWLSGARLVDELNAFATARSDWTYTHRWRVGDLLVWDNRCVLHRGSEYDTARQARVMLRAVVDGTGVPVAARA